MPASNNPQPTDDNSVFVAVRQSSYRGFFELVCVNCIEIPGEEIIPSLTMQEIMDLSTFFWPETPGEERLRMLMRTSPTKKSSWRRAAERARAEHQR